MTISGAVDIADDTFLEQTKGAYTVVDFWAPWCAPCRRFAPVFDDAAETYAGRLRFAKCNVDEAQATAELVQVTTIPTVVLFDPEGSEVGRVVNPPPGGFDGMLAEVVREREL